MHQELGTKVLSVAAARFDPPLDHVSQLADLDTLISLVRLYTPSN